MSVTVNHAMLVDAFEYAIAESRIDGIHVVDNLLDWRNNYGSKSNRITTLYGTVAHHTGSEVSASRITSYVRGLGTGSIRPEIGRVLCNTASIRSGVWPGSDNKPTIVVLAADYANHAGLGDQGMLDEIKDGDIDMSGEFKPGGDDLYLNRYFLGDEGVGSYTDESQQRAVIVFYAHVMWKLGLLADNDKDGRWAPLVAHREITRRKVDPARANLSKMRSDMQDFVNQRYGLGIPTSDPLVVVTPTPPAPAPSGYSNPHTPVTADGVWGKKTSLALQHVLKHKYNAWGLSGPLVVDGVMDKESYRALQRVLNQEAKAGLAEDGLFGKATKRALQRYVGTTADGIIGPMTVRALQRKINGGF